MVRATAPVMLVFLIATAAMAETPVDRGRYLVDAVLACRASSISAQALAYRAARAIGSFLAATRTTYG